MNEVNLKDFSSSSLLAFGLGGSFELLLDTPIHAFLYNLFSQMTIHVFNYLVRHSLTITSLHKLDRLKSKCFMRRRAISRNLFSCQRMKQKIFCDFILCCFHEGNVKTNHA